MISFFLYNLPNIFKFTFLFIYHDLDLHFIIKTLTTKYFTSVIFLFFCVIIINFVEATKGAVDVGHIGEVNHQVALVQQEQNGTIADMQTDGNHVKYPPAAEVGAELNNSKSLHQEIF